MKKEIIINTFLKQIEIKEDGQEKIFLISENFDLKEFKSQNEINKFIKNYLISNNFILDYINNYEIKVI